MISIKINKIAAIGLLIVVVIGFDQAEEFMNPLQGDVEQEMYIRGGYPKVDEVFEVVYRVKLKEKNRLNEFPEKMVAMGYVMSFTSRPTDPIKFLSNKEVFVPFLNSGEWSEFSAKLKITECTKNIMIIAGTRFQASKSGAFLQMTLYLLDSLTGQYGTWKEYERQLHQKAEWWYDPAGEFTSDPVSPDCAKRNREIIAQLKQIEPNLTDWEALYLHYDGIQALMGGMGDGKTTWEDRWKFLLGMGWLEKQRAGKEIKEKWLKEMIEKYKGKPLIKEQGLNPNFFRGDSDSIGNNSHLPDSTKRWSYFYFNGQFRYKKHLYNKDQGLLAQTVDMPICSILRQVI